MLITLYGINNIGKTTHTTRLVDELNAEGYETVRIKYPVYNIEPSGSFLNKTLRGGAQGISEEELQMWFVINRYQFQPQLQAWLDEGKVVVAEDYIGTGIAWGTTKGLSTDWLESLNQYLIQPNLSILIDGERMKKAIEKGHVHEENDELIQRSRQIHLTLAKEYGWTKVELQPTKDATFALIWDEVCKQLPT